MIDIVSKKECTGCWSCANICPQNCIDMETDNEGFLYPIVNKSKCIECKKCIKSCPILNTAKINNTPIAYACINKNKEIRKKSTSGGMFTLIAENIINEDGVVFGAKFNQNFDVEHSYINNKEDIVVFRGSKYVQSKIGNTYIEAKNFLEHGKKVLYSGTPCQIAGLKTFLGKEYDNLICIDLVCHGVPSPSVWTKYKNQISKGKKIKDVSFRNKTHGWRDYSLKIDFKDDTYYLEKGTKNKYIRGFIGDIYLRESCYNCKFKSIYRQSDLTLADFWGIENVLKEMDDGKGTSLVIINSEKGSKIIQNIKDKIYIKEVDLQKAIKYNGSAVKSTYRNPQRDYFFRNMNKYEFNKLVDKSLKEPLLIRIKTRIKNLIGF